uniref:Uncharacterized protein n=1 Tax=Chenopodium quinoa TaxID=63459 RepID=A0A803MI71_CHEQI
MKRMCANGLMMGNAIFKVQTQFIGYGDDWPKIPMLRALFRLCQNLVQPSPLAHGRAETSVWTTTVQPYKDGALYTAVNFTDVDAF